MEYILENTSENYELMGGKATALAKITLGRIRTRYTQSDALWTQDGAAILEEGTQELNDIRERLQKSTQLVYPID